jgi:hypothetical protein
MTTVNVSQGDTTVVTVTTAGPQGPGGGVGAAYVHTQASPATTWTINHNLGLSPISGAARFRQPRDRW